MDNIFELMFIDGTKYKGGIDYKDTKWKEIPDKEIAEIRYNVPNSDEVIDLKGYEKYYHMIEATMDVMNGNQGVLNIESAYIMGFKKGNIDVCRIYLKTGKYDMLNFDIEDSFIKKLNPIFWKKGV